LRPFSPNISKDSFVRFVENQRLARRKRKIPLSSKFLAPKAVRKPPPGAAGKRDIARSDNKKPSTLFVFPKDEVAIEEPIRVRRGPAAAPSSGGRMIRPIGSIRHGEERRRRSDPAGVDAACGLRRPRCVRARDDGRRR